MVITTEATMVATGKLRDKSLSSFDANSYISGDDGGNYGGDDGNNYG
jgi:hypothetical protein